MQQFDENIAQQDYIIDFSRQIATSAMGNLRECNNSTKKSYTKDYIMVPILWMAVAKNDLNVKCVMRQDIIEISSF